MAFERWGPSSSACHQLEQTNNRPQESAVPLGYAEVHHLEGWHFFYISAARSSATGSMKGLLAILLPKKNCSVGRACCIVLLMLNHQCWKSTFVRMNDWRSVMAGACPSASTGMQPLLFLKPANGFRNNDKSQLMLLSPTENQICNFCWQQSTAMCNCFGKNNVTYLTRPPGNPGYYEFITTVIGKFWCSTAVKRQKGQWSPSPVLKICIRRVWGCQRWDRRVKTVPEGTVLELELYTHFIWDMNGLDTYYLSHGQGTADWERWWLTTSTASSTQSGGSLGSRQVDSKQRRTFATLLEKSFGSRVLHFRSAGKENWNHILHVRQKEGTKTDGAEARTKSSEGTGKNF